MLFIILKGLGIWAPRVGGLLHLIADRKLDPDCLVNVIPYLMALWP